MKILVSAYACEPAKGSEPYVGWNLPRHLARYNQIVLLTRGNNREKIEAELRKTPTANLTVAYFDLPKWLRWWKKGNRGIHVYYYLWQIGAYAKARRLHKQFDFDVAHHLTFGMDWIPSFLWLLPVPFVCGPLVGAETVARSFRRTFSWVAIARENVRACVRRLVQFDPVMRMAARRTAVALASGPQLRERLIKLGYRDVRLCASVAISRREIDSVSGNGVRPKSGRMRFVCVGNLFAFRAFDAVLGAFSSVLRDVDDAELWFIGDGPERRTLTSKAQQLGVARAVTFWGTVARDRVLKLLSDCDVLVYPCLRGAISMACLEAMAAGLPVITLDIGGTALQVSDQAGIRIPAVNPNQLTEALAAAMRGLAIDAGARLRLAQGARERARGEFSWEAKASFISELYTEVVQHQRPERYTAAQAQTI